MVIVIRSFDRRGHMGIRSMTDVNMGIWSMTNVVTVIDT